jgi:hypothetical protein
LRFLFGTVRGVIFELFCEKELRATRKNFRLILVSVDQFSVSHLWAFKKGRNNKQTQMWLCFAVFTKKSCRGIKMATQIKPLINAGNLL